MKRRIEVAIALGLAIPAFAFAQGSGEKDQGHDEAHPGEQPPSHPRVTGEVRGNVTRVNLPDGTLEVRAGHKTVELNAAPPQIAGLAPGDLVDFPYAEYDGARWLAPTAGGPRKSFSSAFSQPERMTGAVQAMAYGAGTITVRAAKLRIHPALLQDIRPGMYVNVLYVQIESASWVTEIAPVPPTSPPEEPAPDDRRKENDEPRRRGSSRG